jgi:hypothetical protein
MSQRRAVLGAVIVGLVVTGTYHVFETVDPRQDLWFAGLAAGIGLVTVPLLIDLAVVDLAGRFLHRERHLPRIRLALVAASGVLGVVLVAWASARAATDPAAGAGFVVLPVLVFALGVLALIVVVVAGADEAPAPR